MNGYILHLNVNIVHQKGADISALHFPFHKQKQDLTTNLIKLECFPGLMQQATPHAVASPFAGAPGNRNSSDAAWLTLPPSALSVVCCVQPAFFLLIAFHLLNSIRPTDECIEISSLSSVTNLVSFKVRSYSRILSLRLS